ncbi:hypothetical protein EXIGLDRAFT_698746 [Exidia glandulosa HHB12029]|uniref:Uncharacterized protein n=1 Tax=Exidia glandulosa HHB12029 TaxID=1314781 RepID=A0A165ZVL7_EXIGL|nr:hypothetical protein EXIGLDRAFT_698746 [Exidia glandulosa HHB12029]
MYKKRDYHAYTEVDVIILQDDSSYFPSGGAVYVQVAASLWNEENRDLRDTQPKSLVGIVGSNAYFLRVGFTMNRHSSSIEYVVPAGAFSADDLDVEHVVLQRLGLGLVGGQDLIREDVEACTTRVKGHALTWIDGGWSCVTKLTDAIELGLSASSRFVVQTDTKELVVLDQAYGMAFVVTASELYEGIAVADLYRKVQLTNWNGELWPAHPPSTRIYASQDWVHSFFESDPHQHRLAQWELYVGQFTTYPTVAKNDKRTIDDLRLAQLMAYRMSTVTPFVVDDLDWSASVYNGDDASSIGEHERLLPMPSIMADASFPEAANAVEELDAFMREQFGRTLDDYPAEDLDAKSVIVSATEAEGAPKDSCASAFAVAVQVDDGGEEATVQVVVTPPRYSRLQPATPEEVSILDALALEEYEPSAPAYRVDEVQHVEAEGGESDSTGGYSDLPDLLSVTSTTSSSSATGLSTHYAGVPLFPIAEEYESSAAESSLGRSSDSGPAVVLERERRPYGYSGAGDQTELRAERMQRLANEQRVRRSGRELRRSYFERAVERVQGWRRSLSRSSGSSE